MLLRVCWFKNVSDLDYITVTMPLKNVACLKFEQLNLKLPSVVA